MVKFDFHAICLPACLSICVSYLFVSLSAGASVCLQMSIFVCLTICLSQFLPCLFNCDYFCLELYPRDSLFLFSFSFIIIVISQAGLYKEALGVMDRMAATGIKPDITMVSQTSTM